MKVNVNDYKINIHYLEYLLKTNPNKNPFSVVTEFASCTFTPITVSFYYLGIISGFSDEILVKLLQSQKFYEISELEGVTDEFRIRIERIKGRN